jgi:hypothetical protein
MQEKNKNAGRVRTAKRRKLVRPTSKWEDNIKTYLTEVG